MEYHTAAVTGLLYVLVIQLSTEASTISPVRKPVLETSKSRPTDGEQYTLICNYDGRTAAGHFAVRQVFWYRDSSHVFTSPSGGLVPDKASDLDGRVSVRSTDSQHSITISINASIDNGSVWWCGDDVTRQDSNNFTIKVMTVRTISSPTSVTSFIDRTTSNTEMMTVRTISSPTSVTSFIDRTTSNTDTPNVVYVVIGVIGGAVVGCVITAAVVIAWMKKRHIRREDNINTPNIYDSASHYEDMDHQYGSVKKQYVNTVEGTAADTQEYVNTDEDNRDTAYYNIVHDTNLPTEDPPHHCT